LLGRGLEKFDDWRAWREFPKDSRPHLMLLTADTLRADGPHFMNPAAHVTPVMDALASEGCVFRNASSAAPWTIPSFAAIMTGQTPGVHGVVIMTRKLSDKFETLAERLRARGYRTEAHVMNAYLSPQYCLDQGFERYHYLSMSTSETSRNPIARLCSMWPGSYLMATMNEKLIMNVNLFFERRASRPFFLWVHFLDPHEPLNPSDASLRKITSEKLALRRFSRTSENQTFTPTEKKEIQLLYRAEVLDLDLALGSVFASMKRNGIYNETAIMFTSDHGEAFWEHRGYGHGFALYQEQTHVPLVIRLGENGPVGDIYQPVSNARIFTTFLDLAGIVPEDPLMEDQSLLGLVNGEESEAVPVYSSGTSHRLPPQHSIIAGDHKLMQFDEIVVRHELYNLSNDPMEKQDITNAAPGILNPALETLEKWLDRQNALSEELDLNISDITIELDQESLAELEAIGYFQ